MSNICLTCGGLIAEQGVAYGFVGKFCQCIVPPKIQRPASETFHVPIAWPPSGQVGQPTPAASGEPHPGKTYDWADVPAQPTPGSERNSVDALSSKTVASTSALHDVWYAYFTDHRDTSKGVLQSTMMPSISNNWSEILVVPKSALTAAESELREMRAKYNFMVDSAQQNARERDALQAKYDELVSYLPKVPTEPYEKRLSREHRELQAKCARLEQVVAQQKDGSYLLGTFVEHGKLVKERDAQPAPKEFIKRLVDRFLAWKLPAGVRPDLFPPESPHAHNNSGTNLLTATEAQQLFEYLFPYDPEINSAVGWMVKYERQKSALTVAQAEIERLQKLHLQRTKDASVWLEERDALKAKCERLEADNLKTAQRMAAWVDQADHLAGALAGVLAKVAHHKERAKQALAAYEKFKRGGEC